jgi:hypothetical protein
MVVLGRGRHIDYGQRHGIRGSLTAQLYGDSINNVTAREQRLRLDAVKQSKGFVYLRNPFGDIFKADLQGFTVDRVAGVGAQEYATVTIPYIEVTA